MGPFLSATYLRFVFHYFLSDQTVRDCLLYDFLQVLTFNCNTTEMSSLEAFCTLSSSLSLSLVIPPYLLLSHFLVDFLRLDLLLLPVLLLAKKSIVINYEY